MFDLHLLKQKAKRIWDKQLVQQAALTKETVFPLKIALDSVTSKQLQTDFVLIRKEVSLLLDLQSKLNFELQFKIINHRDLGRQQIPTHIIFNSLESLLEFIGKKTEYVKLLKVCTFILDTEPRLRPWVITNTPLILNYEDRWDKLLKVCKYFLANPYPNKYLRELDIAGVDSKFIEQHKGILAKLLESLPLPKLNLNENCTFEERYGIKQIKPLIRFRLLDKNKIWLTKVTDISIPLNEFKELDFECQTIFITENKINGLCFPLVCNSIVIFGLGYGLHSLKDISWFKNKKIIYWGDIDTHGFAMLSQLRGYYPQTKSLMMDKYTLDEFKALWVKEPSHARCVANLAHLTHPEEELYQLLSQNTLGSNIRLEQERISLEYAYNNIYQAILD
jgi:hypothetical protein